MTRETPLDPRRIEVPDPEMVRVLRAKTGAERLQIVCEMHAAARRMLRASLSARHPEWDEEKLQQEVKRRLLHGVTLAQSSRLRDGLYWKDGEE